MIGMRNYSEISIRIFYPFFQKNRITERIFVSADNKTNPMSQFCKVESKIINRRRNQYSRFKGITVPLDDFGTNPGAE